MHAVRWLASPRQGENALLNDFWYFSSLKSTRKEKHLYVSFSLPRKQNYFQQIEYTQVLLLLQFHHEAKMLARKLSAIHIIPQNRQKVKHLFASLEKILKVRANFYFFIAIIIKA